MSEWYKGYIAGVIVVTLISMCSAKFTKAEFVTCPHKNNKEVTITSGKHKGKTGKITLSEQYLGEMWHRIEVVEEIRVNEEELK